MNKYKALFLQQSYRDSFDTYKNALNGKIPVWDYVVLTASNEAQAKAYEEQIDYRKSLGVLPENSKYAVIPDPDGKRCGSGGATLAVLKYIAEKEGLTDFSSEKILVIHSGGDSKRVPQYSACGKIFSPVPRILPDGRRSTLFDEFMIGCSGIPARIASGMLVCSGDVLLLFNSLQIDFYEEGAAALSIKEKVETGKNHGVFLGNADGKVKKCLQKQSVETLTSCGAVDKNGNVDIDTGAVIFSGKMVNSLYSLIDTDEKFKAKVNDTVRLSFYADFLYPLAEDSTLDLFYKEKPEGDFTPELSAARKEVWDALHKYNMKLIRFSPAAFLHFGTTKELLKLVTEEIENYSFLDWKKTVNSNCNSSDFAVYNSYISKNSTVGYGSYIENSDIHYGTTIGKGSVVSGVKLHGEAIPDNTVIHGLKLKDGKFVCRMYGIDDNPKENNWLGKTLKTDLWSAPLFKVCDNMSDAVKATLNGENDGELVSLKESFNLADSSASIPWENKLNDKIIAETVAEAIDNLTPVEDVIKMFPNGISERVERYLVNKAEKLDGNILEEFSQKIRIYFYASKLSHSEKLSDKCFKTICDSVLTAAINDAKYNPDYRIIKDKVVTRLPVRVNWGGGWSDTPPYCLEHGGTVLNAAVKLDGKYPIEVTVKSLTEPKIVLASTDIGSCKEYTDIKELQDMSSDSLHKAALIACGVIPYKGNISVEEICKNLGGGLYLNTKVINIPKGSGLGTSSILAGACVKGIFEFFDVKADENELYNRVLCMEQIMTTGGGWQDQVGGLAKGIKTVSAAPGLKQKIVCTPLNIPQNALEELNERIAVIYTGQRRLARNLLREVVGKYIGANKVALDVLNHIQQVAVLMRFELERGNINEFAKLLSYHWELSQKLDKGCTNTCIDQIFIAIDDLIDGKMICGAGGGGFLQVILKKGVTVQMLRDRLDEVFADSGVSVWDCDFDL